MSASRPADHLLEVEEAVARVVGAVAPLGTERVPLAGARGRVLARSAVSRVALPPWDNSAMDGYAVRAADVAAVPATLRVIESVQAGAFPSRTVGAGEATRVATGAPIPDGADSVIRVEDTDGGRDRVEIRDARDAGKNVRPRGEDVGAGQEALPAGATLGAAQIGVLASIGVAEVEVHREPRVAILTSGDELVLLDRFAEVEGGKKIVSSNSYALEALVLDAGGVPVPLGIAADTKESLRTHFERARGADLVISSAGVSVGEFDYTREVLAEMGATLDFWRVRMRPGGPVGFGAFGKSPWLGLPGNPVSTMVTFELYARPVIRKMRGHTRLFPRAFPVTVEEPITLGADLTHFLRAVVTTRADGTRAARLTGAQGSGLLTSVARANALLVVPRGKRGVVAGESLNALPLGGEAALASEFAL